MSDNLIAAIRQNHALEHATINVMIKRLGLTVRLVGQTTIDGFYIYGDIPSDVVRESAEEALARLQRGESELAISPLCGTNLVVAGILAGIASYIVLGGRRRLGRLPTAIAAATWATVAAQPAGRAVQRHVTTSPDLYDVRIKRITRRGAGRRMLHKVETARASEQDAEELPTV
ncbi:MAG: DUF6391 domain-containing protein [Chloroflexota bacterium]|nr:DUF6391 domain-containing protein [Chloroflexota bacterium]